MALKVISDRFPMGVDTIYKPGFKFIILQFIFYKRVYFMNNIKQKLIKFITSFFILVSFSGCQTDSQPNKKNDYIVNIALLMPTTGPEKEQGEEYIKMIKAGLHDSAETKLRVTSYDSSDEQVLNESLKTIFDKGTDIIIGPIYSAATKMAYMQAKDKGTIILSLSNNPSLANEQTYVLGHAPMQQLITSADFFLKNKFQDYVMLLPEGRYSETMSKVLKNRIEKNDGTVKLVQYYNSEDENIDNAISRVEHIVDESNEDPFNIKRPVLILSDDSKMIAIVLAKIEQSSLDKKAVIVGDNRSDIELYYPIKMFVTSSAATHSPKFIAKTKKLGIKNADFLHAIAYDAGRMTAKYIGQNYDKKLFLARMNNNQKYFHGVSGKIQFKDFIAQRQYDILRRNGNNFKLIPTRR